jgi:hypothetical protein
MSERSPICSMGGPSVETEGVTVLAVITGGAGSIGSNLVHALLGRR